MKKLTAMICACVIGSAASAQEFYIGGALDYGLPHSGDSQTAASVIAGGGFFIGMAAQAGAEIEFGLPLGGDADYETGRLRAWGSVPVGGVAVHAAAGVTQFALDGGNAGGFNVGLGVSRDFSSTINLRGEFIRDFMDDDFADVTTTRIAILYKF